MVQKIIEFLLVNAPYIVPGLVVAALFMSEYARVVACFLLRMVARPLLLIAVVALVYDGTRTLAGGSGIVITSLMEHWQGLFPASLDGLKQFVVRRMSQAAWDGGLLKMLRLPAWLVLGVLGLVLAWIGRKRHKVNVYMN
ncbi:MAG: hypothetical protein ACKVP7_28045 [Hyphomicrobiaceae bacterium]